MNRENKKILRNILIGAGLGVMLILAGLVAGVNCGFALHGNLGTTAKAANTTYTAEGNIETVAIEAEAGRITLRTADVAKTSVDYFTDGNIQVTCVEWEGTLTVSQTVSLPSFLNGYGGELVITMPAGTKQEVTISLDAGNVFCKALNAEKLQITLGGGNAAAENCTAETAAIRTGAGDIDLNACTLAELRTAADTGNIKGRDVAVDGAAFAVGTGEIDVECRGAKNEYTLTGKTDFGECNFADQAGSTQKYIHAQTDIGNIRIVFTTA